MDNVNGDGLPVAPQSLRLCDTLSPALIALREKSKGHVQVRYLLQCHIIEAGPSDQTTAMNHSVSSTRKGNSTVENGSENALEQGLLGGKAPVQVWTSCDRWLRCGGGGGSP